MIRYRYNMSVDPEPPVHRVQTVHGPTLGGTRGYLGDTWVRASCEMKVSGFVYGRWPNLRIGRSHRSVPKSQWRRERDFNRTLCRTDDHIHWYNGDRYRAWGNFRGHTGEVIDVDAFSRMRSMYRKRHR